MNACTTSFCSSVKCVLLGFGGSGPSCRQQLIDAADADAKLLADNLLTGGGFSFFICEHPLLALMRRALHEVFDVGAVGFHQSLESMQTLADEGAERGQVHRIGVPPPVKFGHAFKLCKIELREINFPRFRSKYRDSLLGCGCGSVGIGLRGCCA